MKPDHKNALSLYLDRLNVGGFSSKDDCVVFNASPLPDCPTDLKATLKCEQGFRVEYLKLKQTGYDAVPQFSGITKPHNAIVLCGRIRKVNERNICRAWNCCPAGWHIIVAGDKNSGISSLRKWVGEKNTDRRKLFEISFSCFPHSEHRKRLAIGGTANAG